MTRPSSAPIGVFDSGIGGLTVLKALLAELPAERFVYLGDTARLPYGTKTAETVVRYSLQAAEALLDCGVKCLVVACNTASAAGLAAIRERVHPLPVIGVIEPGAAAASRATRHGRIAVLGTERTVSGGAYQQAILEHRADARIEAVAAQLFVALAEEGLGTGPIAESIARHYLAALFDARSAACGPRPEEPPPDTVVLGCTHFPVLAPAIRAVVGPDVRIVDSAQPTARVVRETLAAAGLAATGTAGAVRFIATDGTERFARIGSPFLGRTIRPQEVELVDL